MENIYIDENKTWKNCTEGGEWDVCALQNEEIVTVKINDYPINLTWNELYSSPWHSN